jgi:aspartate/methionine/tyrosine aminotransferase
MRSSGPDIAPFYAGEINRRAAALSRAGQSIIPMHLGQPTRGPSEATLAAAQNALIAGPNGYWESHELKGRLAEHYREWYGVEVAPERILLTNGASAALVAIFAAMFATGERIALARPGYPAYRNTLTALGRVPVELDCGAASRYRLTASVLAALEPAPQGVVVASPANPTGTMLDAVELKELADECKRREIVFISDEIYHGVTYRGRSVSALEVTQDAIIINSFSKFCRMPGWRLGWLVVPPPLIDKLQTYIGNFFLTAPNVAQAAILRELDHQVMQTQAYADEPCDLMVALHARRSFAAIAQFQRLYPDKPLIVALTGTDLYGDIKTSAEARQSLEWATRLILLQPKGIEELPEHLRPKAYVIYQSVVGPQVPPAKPKTTFDVCVLGHLRDVKDPFRAALASRLLPDTSRVRVLHVGKALSEDMAATAAAEALANPRYRWLGELPRWQARRVLARSHILVL